MRRQIKKKKKKKETENRVRVRVRVESNGAVGWKGISSEFTKSRILGQNTLQLPACLSK